MCDINLRNVDAALKSELKIEAAQAGMTFKEYCVGLLSGALLRGFTVWNKGDGALPVEGINSLKWTYPEDIPERTVEYGE